ncbi:hypothetical protein SGFS_065080 [Streptomyces graminofaciens]|uniref:Uncharacterized protein n=2 Tax=Streptomyces graminofaciens TaxID=68212 RepID=A0ABM7FGM9_9ACTN|nr:hypothetical protein SGFS_065080 [Streptomyces graminofaciens]
MDILVFFFADLSAPAAICLGVGTAAAVSVPALLLADAHRSDFPRVWQAAVHACHTFDRALVAGLRWVESVVLDARLTARDAALTAAALLALLLPATEGATR